MLYGLSVSIRMSYSARLIVLCLLTQKAVCSKRCGTVDFTLLRSTLLLDIIVLFGANVALATSAAKSVKTY